MISWICVSIDINESKLRKMRKALKCSNFEAKGICVTLWQWAAKNNVDDDGYIIDADEEDVAEYLEKENISGTLRGEEMVKALIDAGFLESSESSPICIHDWDDNQRYLIQYRKIRKNDAENKRKARMRKAEEKKTKLKPETGFSNLTKPAGEQKKEAYTDGFLRVWEEYPRKDDKGEAYKKYKARLAEGYDEESLYEAVKSYAADVRKKHTEKSYILMGKTFFGPDGRFLQYLPKDKPETYMTVMDGKNPFAMFAEEG